MIYVVVMFVFMAIDIGLLSIGSILLTMFFGFISITIGGIALTPTYSSDIPFSPYFQLAMMMCGGLCLLVGASRFKIRKNL